jgi:predicted transcriptional regulator
MTLNLELDEQQARRLQQVASRLNVSVSDLARAAINDLLAKPDNDFERAAERVLKKNSELYKRLA